MLTSYGKIQWLIILALTAMLAAAAAWLAWWWALAMVVAGSLALLSFFRDPPRAIPVSRGVMVSPADGLISSVHQVPHFQPLGEPAVCIRIFLSVLDVHVNRSPCHGMVASVEHKPGQYLNALNPHSAEVNAATLLVLVHPTNRRPVAAVRQVAGLIARTIVCAAKPGDILQRGQRYGMIKFGSTTELYLPAASAPQVLVEKGQRVYGGKTILARINASAEAESPSPDAAPDAASSQA